MTSDEAIEILRAAVGAGDLEATALAVIEREIAGLRASDDRLRETLERVTAELYPDSVPVVGIPPMDDAHKVLELINALRAADGNAPALAWSVELAGAAKAHAEWMERRERLSHALFRHRLRAAGFDLGAENVASGQSTPGEVVVAWQGSPGHRLNQMNRSWSLVGAARSGDYWCAIFSRPE